VYILAGVLCCLQSLEAAAVTYARMQDFGRASSYLDRLVSLTMTTPNLKTHTLNPKPFVLVSAANFGTNSCSRTYCARGSLLCKLSTLWVPGSMLPAPLHPLCAAGCRTSC
jgi:hypothetical protein